MVAQTLRRRRGKPLFIIDLAVPRDVDPRVNEIDNVYVYDIDGLQNVVDTHHRERREAAEQARLLIEREVDAFDRWRQTLEVTPTIVSLREQLTAMARQELERGRRRLGPLNAEQHRAIEELLRGLVQKMLHRPVMHLRKSVERGDIDASTTLYREIFGLDESPGGNLREEDDGASSGSRLPESGPRRLLRGGKDD